MKLSIQENLVPGKTFAERLEAIEHYGFEGVEIWGRNLPDDWNKYHAHVVPAELETIKAGIASSKIVVSTICAYPGELLAGSRDERYSAVSAVEERLRICADIGGVGVITVPVFGAPKISVSSRKKEIAETEKKILVEQYKLLAKTAEDLGVYVLLEPINRYETHLINTIEQAIEIHEKVGSDGLKIMVDFFHANIEEANIQKSLENALSYLGHLHLADSNRMLPGRGHTDFKSAFELIKKAGYDGFLAIESNVPDSPKDDLPRCVQYLRSCF